jgi:hypothetical protein
LRHSFKNVCQSYAIVFRCRRRLFPGKHPRHSSLFLPVNTYTQKCPKHQRLLRRESGDLIGLRVYPDEAHDCMTRVTTTRFRWFIVIAVVVPARLSPSPKTAGQSGWHRMNSIAFSIPIASPIPGKPFKSSCTSFRVSPCMGQASQSTCSSLGRLRTRRRRYGVYRPDCLSLFDDSQPRRIRLINPGRQCLHSLLNNQSLRSLRRLSGHFRMYVCSPSCYQTSNSGSIAIPYEYVNLNHKNPNPQNQETLQTQDDGRLLKYASPLPASSPNRT